MSISGVGYHYYQNNVTAKNTKNVNGTAKFALEKTSGKQQLTEAEEMELFKKEFYEELSKIKNHRTVSNAAVNISEAAFKAMKADPQYKEKVLSLIQRDLGDSYAPRNCSVLIRVGETLNEYGGDSWPVDYDSEFDMRSQNSFYKRTSDKKDRQKEILEEYLEKHAQVKRRQQELLDEKIAKTNQERSRLTKSWNSEKQMAKAVDAYDFNVVTETTAIHGNDKTFEMGSATRAATADGDGKNIGVMTIGNQAYLAQYSENSTPAKPIVKVGDYEVSVNDVDPENATEIEMFALMSHLDKTGQSKNEGMSSFSKLRTYSQQAERNGFCSGIADADEAWSSKRNWMEILKNARQTYSQSLIPEIYTLTRKCDKLLDTMQKWIENRERW